MKTLIASAFIACLPQLLLGQDSVLIGGGSTQPRPVMRGHGSVRVVVTKVVFHQDNPLNPYATAGLNYGTEAPLVSQVAVASYSPSYHRCADTYRSSHSYRPPSSVIYFGRGESCQRSYSYRHHW